VTGYHGVVASIHWRARSIELTKELIAQSRVIAKGKRIRDVQRLLDQSGGQRSKWVKKSSPVFESEGTLHEYHWYEHYGIGRLETKLKVAEEK
jgi:hypothetical protein